MKYIFIEKGECEFLYLVNCTGSSLQNQEKEIRSTIKRLCNNFCSENNYPYIYLSYKKIIQLIKIRKIIII